jgi:hypothetical protein
MRRYEQIVAAGQGNGLPGDLKERRASQQQHPLVMVLIVEDRIRFAATADALDAQISTAQQLLEDLAGGWRWPVGEQVTALDQRSN